MLSDFDADLLVMRKLLGERNALLEAEQRGWSFELALPHLQGLTPMQLFDLREELPDAFEAFRAKLALYCLDSRNVEHAQSKAEELTKLEIELAASLRAKFAHDRVIGYGSGVLTAASILLGALGISFSALYSRSLAPVECSPPPLDPLRLGLSRKGIPLVSSGTLNAAHDANPLGPSRRNEL